MDDYPTRDSRTFALLRSVISIARSQGWNILHALAATLPYSHISNRRADPFPSLLGKVAP
jgi:hypothetical protein